MDDPMHSTRARSVFLLVCITAGAVLWLLWPGLQSESGDALALASRPATIAVQAEAGDLPDSGQVGPELGARVEEDEPTNKPEPQARGSMAEEVPRTGFIHGNLRDSSGAIISQGRVLIFGDRDLSKEVATLELEGPEREYSCELPAGKSYYLLVDPASLGSGYVPALGRSRGRSTERSHDQRESPDLTPYTKYFVTLGGGEQVRRDLQVGLLARAWGRLLDSNGSPIEGALARMSGLSKDISGLSEDAMTDSSGLFSYVELFPGDYRLTFSRAEAWSPPRVLDMTIHEAEVRDLGEFRAGGDGLSIRGRIVNQDGDPFPGLRILCYSNQPVEKGQPGHNMSSSLGRTTTDARGGFQLVDLPAIPVNVALTPEYHPNTVAGAGEPAFWVHPVPVDLSSRSSPAQIGTHTVDESRPFELSGRITFDASWLARQTSARQELECTISQVGDQALPEGVRRAPLNGKPVGIDFEAQTYSSLVETPMTKIELRFELEGYEDLVFTLQPAPHESWSRDIQVPLDFEPRNP